MKKSTKVILIIITLLVLLYIINVSRNFYIINKISKAYENLVLPNNFQMKIVQDSIYLNSDFNNSRFYQTIFRKDNKVFIGFSEGKSIDFIDFYTILYYDLDKKEFYTIYNENKTYYINNDLLNALNYSFDHEIASRIEPFLLSINHVNKTNTHNLTKLALTSIITTDETSYTIHSPWYKGKFDKNLLWLPLEEVYKSKLTDTQTINVDSIDYYDFKVIKYEQNIVPDGDVALPDLSNYTLQQPTVYN